MMNLPNHIPLVAATRGDVVESVHYGSIAVVTASDELLCSAGDADFPIYTRSTLKPFQALPLILDGGPARYGFSSEQVALLCASHSGEPYHVAALADMLARIGCREADLQCGCHPPFYYTATGIAQPADLRETPLHHNCSGKHIGFLAWCRLHDLPVANYLDPEHPLQQTIRSCIAHMCGREENQIPMGIDGCGAPNYALPLVQLASLYARLATHKEATPEDSALFSLFTAMTQHPEMVSGSARTDLALMQAAPGDWVSKGGAEGMQALGISSRGLGIAIKIADGSKRALHTVLGHIIEQLDLQPNAHIKAIPELRGNEILNHTGRQTGRLLPLFELNYPG